MISLLFILAVGWVILLKLYGLWRSARNDAPVWFVVIAFLNTLGILPLVYLVFFQKEGALLVRKKVSKRKNKKGK